MNAIEVIHITKKFRLGTYNSAALKQDVLKALRLKKTVPQNRGERIDAEGKFIALEDIHFNVQQGEVLGIIGKNGAGKSTLLKLLSQISRPTEGKIRIAGKVSSLLEVGTGFHPELTGMENIFLNGAILGMSKKEIRLKLDEIIAFAGIEHHIESPVKRYSSGMKVRLGFAVAAHLEPEILIVDEVLAVGDAEFQRKCLGKMQDVAGHGRTVLFVSHNMAAVKNLCTRGIVLDQGKIVFDGYAEAAVTNYLNLNDRQLSRRYVFSDAEREFEDFRLVSMYTHPETDHISMNDSFEIVVEVEVKEKIKNTDFTFHVLTDDETIAFTSSTAQLDESFVTDVKPGIHRFKLPVPARLMNARKYYVSLLLIKNRATLLKKFEKLIEIDITDIKQDNRFHFGKRNGVLSPALTWTKEDGV